MGNLKDTIVLIPGWGFNKEIFIPLIEWLSTKYEIINLEFPISKLSLRTNDEILNNISKTFYNKIPDNSIIIGWSLGGLLASHFCYLFPQKCKKIINLCSTPKFVATETWNGIHGSDLNGFRNLAYRDLEKLIKKISMLVVNPIKDRKLISQIRNRMKDPITDRKELLLYLDILIDSDIRKDYSKISSPILHIIGEKDNIVPKNIVDNFKELNQKNVKIISESGHIPFWTHKEELFESIDTFLNKKTLN